MTEFNQIFNGGFAGQNTFTQNLIVFCIQTVQAGINHIIKIFFQKAEKWLVTSSENRHTVNLIISDQVKRGGMLDINGGKGIFQNIILFKSFFFNAMGKL